MRAIRTVLALTSVVAVAVSASDFAGSPRAAAAEPATVVQGQAGTRLDAFLTELARKGFSGGVLVAQRGQIVLHKGYGLADKSRKIPVTTETVFDIGSITKQFTAAAILKLEMAGRLSTDDKITKYFDNVPADKSTITLHHLLTHSAGFDHAYGEDTDVAPRDATVKLILSKPLLSRPGEKYRYSNPGFSLLAAIVEKVSGQPYERFLNGQLFQPAGMTKTGYRLPKWDPKEISHNYSDGKDNGPPLDRVWASDGPYWHLFGNGGILSTTGDMYRWQLALDGETVLSAAEKAKLFKPYMPTDNPSTFYAYGWTVGKTRAGAPVIGHTGGSEFGVWAAHFRFPDDRTVVIVQCNQIPVPGNEDHKLPERLDDIASGRSSGSS